MRASVYARISSDREGAGLGVATQEHDCRELADKLGWQVVSTHTDNDVSAYSGKPRPGYQALLAEIESGAVGAVLAWHSDRLHRSPAELEDYVKLCEAHGVATHTVKAGPIDLSTPSGRLVARQLGSVARYEIEHAVERMQRAKLRSAAAGTWKGGRRPFGFHADGVTVLQPEADLVLSGTRDLLAGASLGEVARRWNAAGSLTTHGRPCCPEHAAKTRAMVAGRPWDASAVRRVMLRPRNAGLMEHQGKEIGPAQWPAIVPEAEWRSVVTHIRDPKRVTTTGPRRRWLGSGLYTCSVCRQTVVCSIGGAKGRKAYRCKPGHVNRNAADLDRFVRHVIAARLRRADLADLLAGHSDDPGKYEALQAEAMAVRARLKELARLYMTEVIDAGALAEGTRVGQERLADIEQAQADAVRVSALDSLAGSPDPGQAFLDADLDRQRGIVRTLVTVELLPGHKGRPADWKPGESYFDPASVRITWV
jgi:DNA invertase Pin-like site-specific DNA recombinase